MSASDFENKTADFHYLSKQLEWKQLNFSSVLLISSANAHKHSKQNHLSETKWSEEQKWI